MELLTFGHGTLEQGEISRLLVDAGVRCLVDVRSAPGSRRHPHVARSAMERWVPDAGIRYRWEPRLGGWRKTAADSPSVALRNASFRGYADYMRSDEFWSGLDGVLREAESERTAVMCSEAVYWRCHRRLIADAAQLARGATVVHLGHDGRLSAHRMTEGARLGGDGLPVYDGGIG